MKTKILTEKSLLRRLNRSMRVFDESVRRSRSKKTMADFLLVHSGRSEPIAYFYGMHGLVRMAAMMCLFGPDELIEDPRRPGSLISASRCQCPGCGKLEVRVTGDLGICPECLGPLAW